MNPIKDTLVPLLTNFNANGSVRWRSSVFLNLFHWPMGKHSGNHNGVCKYVRALSPWLLRISVVRTGLKSGASYNGPAYSICSHEQKNLLLIRKSADSADGAESLIQVVSPRTGDMTYGQLLLTGSSSIVNLIPDPHFTKLLCKKKVI